MWWKLLCHWYSVWYLLSTCLATDLWWLQSHYLPTCLSVHTETSYELKILKKIYSRCLTLFFWHGFPSQRQITASQCNVLLTDLLYPVMNHLCPDGSGWFQDDWSPHPQDTDWKDVKHMLWPPVTGVLWVSRFQSNWTPKNRCDSQCAPPSSKHQPSNIIPAQG